MKTEYCPSNFAEDEELALVSRMMSGDVEARNALVLDNLELIKRIANKEAYYRTPDSFLIASEELACELALEVCTKIHLYEHSEGHRVWRFVTRVCRLRILKLTGTKGVKRRAVVFSNADDEFIGSLLSPREDYRGVEEVAALKEAYGSLKDEQKRIFSSFYDLHDLTFLPYRNPYRRDHPSYLAYRDQYNRTIQALRDDLIRRGFNFHFDLSRSMPGKGYYERRIAEQDQAREARRESYNLSLAEKQARNREKWAARRARDERRNARKRQYQ